VYLCERVWCVSVRVCVVFVFAYEAWQGIRDEGQEEKRTEG